MGQHRLIATALTVLTVCALTACSSSSSHPAQPVGTTGTSSTSGAPVGAAGSTNSTSSAASASPVAHNAGSGVDVCSLLSAMQASALNHVTYGATKSQTVEPGYSTCTYHNTGKHSSPIDIQDLTVTVVSLAGCWAQLQQADGPGKNIPGLGDAAFGAEIQIDVKAGDSCLTIAGLTAAELQGNYGPDIAMAKIILAKLH